LLPHAVRRAHRREAQSCQVSRRLISGASRSAATRV
jgi:hypothetical protein